MNEAYTVWVPIVIAFVGSLITYGVLNWKAVLNRLYFALLRILGRTATVVDEQALVLVVGHMSEYLRSEAFKAHWDTFMGIVGDGKITAEELDVLKTMVSTQLCMELAKVGVSVYDDGGRELFDKAITELAEYIKSQATDSNWFKRVGLAYVLALIAKKVKQKLDSWVVAHRSAKRRWQQPETLRARPRVFVVR